MSSRTPSKTELAKVSGFVALYHSLLTVIVAIRTLWPQIFWTLGNMTLPNNKVKLALTEVDYKPFISLFNVTNATLTNPEISGIRENDRQFSYLLLIQSYTADYASAIALELSKNTAGDYEVALKFKNGTNDEEFKPLKMFGQNNLTLPQLISALDVSSQPLPLTRFYAESFLVDYHQLYH